MSDNLYCRVQPEDSTGNLQDFQLSLLCCQGFRFLGCDALSDVWFLALQMTAVLSSSRVKQSVRSIIHPAAQCHITQGLNPPVPFNLNHLPHSVDSVYQFKITL
jgi:hypothetical protein